MQGSQTRNGGEKLKTWERTKTPGLLRHKGGRYYGRFSIGGKTKFVPLNCTLMEIARVRFAEEKAKIERVRRAARANEQGVATLGQLLEIYRGRITNKTGIAESTRKRNLENVGFIQRTWPGIEKLHPGLITRTEIENWRDRALSKGTGFRPPGAKSESTLVSGRSASSFNKALDALRTMLDYAVDAGTIHVNPVRGNDGLKAKLDPKKPQLPEQTKLREVYAAIEAGGERGGWAVETADFCRFLNFTGCRKAEAGSARWKDYEAGRRMLRVNGTKTAAAFREVPLNDDAIQLLEKIRARREKQRVSQGLDRSVPVEDRILSVSEAQKSLTKACVKVGVPRLTHHDLRDAFATACIEAGV
jgi:integrase